MSRTGEARRRLKPKFHSEKDAIFAAVVDIHLALDLLHDRLEVQDEGVAKALEDAGNAIKWIVRRSQNETTVRRAVEEIDDEDIGAIAEGAGEEEATEEGDE